MALSANQKRFMEKDRLYLEHILLSIQKIKRFCKDVSLENFSNNEMLQSAVIRELEIIGEAAKHVSEKVKMDNKEIPWRLIAGTRDKLIHDYMGVDTFLIYDIYENHLSNLEKQIEELLEYFK
jgi:uncharacterized protein with HEPN domain